MMSDIQDFRGLPLDGHDFSGQDLQECLFQGASLRGARFRGANVSGADFSGCDLSGAEFSEVQAYGAKFPGARLCELRGARAVLSYTELADADFSNAGLQEAEFEDVIGPRANFRAAVLRGADFSGSDLQEAVFESADLEDARFHHCDLRHANFSDANLLRVRMMEPRIEGAVFDGATLPDGQKLVAESTAEPPELVAFRAELPGRMEGVASALALYRTSRDTASRTALSAAWQAILAHPGFAHLPLAVRMQGRVDAATEFITACIQEPALEDLNCTLAVWSELLTDAELASRPRSQQLTAFGDLLMSLVAQGWPPSLLAAAVRWQIDMLELIGAEDAMQAYALYGVGNRLRTGVFRQTHQPEALGLAIDCHRRALTLLPTHAPERCEYLDTLAVDLMTRFQVEDDEADLDEAIRTWRQALAAAALQPGIDPGHLADFAVNLGSACSNRYGAHEALEDLAEAIERLEQALRVAPAGWAGRALAQEKLATCVALRYRVTTDIADLNRAVALRRELLDACDADVADLRQRRLELAELLAARHDASPGPDDLDQALELVEADALDLVASGGLVGTAGVARAELMAALLHRRHELREQPEDAPATVAWTRRALDAATDAAPAVRSGILLELARRLRLQFTVDRSPQLIDEAIERAQEALALQETGHPDRARLLAGLGSDLLVRATFTQDAVMARSEADAGIEHLRRAIALADRRGGPSPRWLMNLAAALQARFREQGDEADTTTALEAWRRALRLVPEDPLDAYRVFMAMLGEAPAELSELLVSDYPGLEALVAEMRRRAGLEDGDLRAVNLARTALATILAEVRTDRHRGGETLEEAIRLTEAVLASSEELEPLHRATLHDLLCRSYAARQAQSRAENLEEAVRHGKAALASITRDSWPEFWAACHTNLANAYVERVHGERAENVELSLNHLESALEVRVRDRYPVQWSMLHNALSLAYMQRVRGRRADNVDQAIEHLTLSLQVRTRERLPGKWADTLSHLANAYRERSAGARGDNLEQALRYYIDAMTVRTREAYPQEWALCQNNLGCVYLDRERGDPAENVRLATNCFDLALEVVTLDGDPWLWSSLHHNASQAAVQSGQIEVAIGLLRQALDGFADFPTSRAHTGRRLGQLLFEQARWAEAHAAFAAATAASQWVFAQAYTDAGRRAEVASTAEVHAMDCWCLLRLGQYAQALERLEAGKARLLSQALALHEEALARLPDSERAALVAAAESVRSLEDRMRRDADAPVAVDQRSLAEQLRIARKDLDDAIRAANRLDASVEPTGLSAAEILKQIPAEGALIAPVITSHGCAVFVVPCGAERVEADQILWLQAFTRESLHDLLIDGTTRAGGWIRSYFRAAVEPQAFYDAIETAGDELWKRLMGPIADRLTEVKASRVLLLPHAGLGLLPLHAAWRVVRGERRYFIDDFVVTYAPSAAVLNAGRRLAPSAGAAPPVRLLAVEDAGDDLVFAGAECRAIARLFDAAADQDKRHSPSWSEGNGPIEASHLHFACHGRYDWENVRRSGLLVGKGQVLTLARIDTQLKLKGSELVVLSACETGVTDLSQSPDEYVGLASGFLAAGAPAVVSSLWSVADLSTMLLMERFYTLQFREALEPSAALRAAQLWLRDLPAGTLQRQFAEEEEAAALGQSDLSLPIASACFARFAGEVPSKRPFAHPYYWAALTCNGVGRPSLGSHSDLNSCGRQAAAARAGGALQAGGTSGFARAVVRVRDFENALRNLQD